MNSSCGVTARFSAMARRDEGARLNSAAMFFGISDYASFVVAVIVFLMIPGPGNLALITSTGKGGIRGGLAATLGVIVGDQVLMWLAVAGVATLLAAYPPAFRARAVARRRLPRLARPRA